MKDNIVPNVIVIHSPVSWIFHTETNYVHLLPFSLYYRQILNVSNYMHV
jgi:hypothetical protein